MRRARAVLALARRWVWTAVALGLLLGVNAVATPSFYEQGAVLDVLNRGSIIVLAALGMTLVIATGGVDLSVGAVVAIAAAACAVTLGAGAPAVAAIGAALLAALAAGCFNGVLVAQARIQPIVATLVLMVAGRGIAQLLTRGQIVTFDDPVLSFLDGGRLLGLPMPVVVTLVVFVGLEVLVRATALGLFVESIGDNATASRLAGVPVRVVTLAAYAISGLCAGVAGVLAAADIRAADANNAGLYLELDAILAVVLGGTALTGGRFSLVGAVLGALFIQTLTTTLLFHDVDPSATLVVKAVAVVGVCLLLSERVRGWVGRLAPGGAA